MCVVLVCVCVFVCVCVCVFVLYVCVHAYVYLAQLLRGKNAINKKEKGVPTFNIIMFIDAFVILDLMCRSPIIDIRRGGKSV